MTYLVTASQQNANRINKLFLRVWAQSLKDDGYGLNSNGDPSTGLRGGQDVPTPTTDWDTPRETTGGEWAVVVPTVADMGGWNRTVRRTPLEVRDLLDLPSGLDFTAFKTELNLPANTTGNTNLDLTVRQWCEGILAAAGIQYRIEPSVEFIT